jgi:hypothetical protein
VEARLLLLWRLLIARRELIRRRILSEEEGKKLILSVGARKRVTRKWTNGLHPPLSLLPLAGGWEANLSSRWRARSPSFEDGVN